MIALLLTGIGLISIYKICNIFKCPKELINVPSVPFWNGMIVFLSKRGYDEKMNQYIQPMLNRYGIIRVYDATGWSLLVGDPQIAKEVSMKPEIFSKPNWNTFQISKLVVQFFGKSQVGTNNGEDWKRHRKIINPIFNQTWSTELIGNCVQDLIQEWEKSNGQQVKVENMIQRMTFDVLGKQIMDIDFKAVKDPNSHLYLLYKNIIDQIMEPAYIILPFLENVPFFKRPQLSRDIKEYDEFVERIKQMRKQEMEYSNLKTVNNLVNALIQSNENTNESKLTDDEIRDNIKLFILAGHDTTSGTLTSTLYYLARYPEIQDKLRKEVLEAMGHPKETTVPTVEQLKQIPFMDLVNKESMRIMTIGSQMERVTTENYTLSNGITVPKDTQVILYLWGIHHNSTVFKNPEKFNPYRFEDLSSEESRSWQPFVTGPRTCIGSTFSMVEQRVTMAMLLQKFEFSMTSDNPDYHHLRLSPITIIRPKDLTLTIKVRN